MPNKSVKELNEEFEKAVQNHHSLNCEKRTNLNLYLGHHFQKTKDVFNRKLEEQGVDKATRIRVTENHIYKICEYISNAILSANADMDIFPANQDELSDQKAAEMHRAVLDKYKRSSGFTELVRKLSLDFVVDGEIATKIFWNPALGEVVGHDEVEDEETGEIKLVPRKSGDVDIEVIFGWDLVYPENAKSAKQAEWVGYQKMMPTKKVIEMAHEEHKKKIQDSSDKTFEIFDPSTGGYNHRKGMTLIREMYTYPCEKYPLGYFHIFNEDIMLYEGELPEGHPFPIKVKGYNEIPTSPRSVSLIRQLRPLQVNVNFGASQQILTQMTLGQDKLIMLGGADLQFRGSQRGVEQWRTNSLQSPTILAGRSGGQFVESANQAVSKMYNIANVPEMGEEKLNQVDAQTALFKQVENKQRFSKVTKKFSEFTQELIEDVLALKKMYMSEEEVVRVVGETEQINIPEFKKAAHIGYQIKVLEVDGDATSLLGKHIELTSMLQYGGQNMDPEQVALIGRNMPFLNKEEIFQEALIDYDTYKNIVLALDRGEQVGVQPFDNADYLLPKITSRMRKADFRYLDPGIQQNYMGFIQALQQVKAQQLHQLKMQQSQLIPTTGGSVPIPIYREVPNSTGGSKWVKVHVPQDGLEQFVQQLEQQGVITDPLMRMEQSTQANIAQEFGAQLQQNTQPELLAAS